jgi:hypothetical protein
MSDIQHKTGIVAQNAKTEDCPWESGALGRSEEHVGVVSAQEMAIIDACAGREKFTEYMDAYLRSGNDLKIDRVYVPVHELQRLIDLAKSDRVYVSANELRRLIDLAKTNLAPVTADQTTQTTQTTGITHDTPEEGCW